MPYQKCVARCGHGCKADRWAACVDVSLDRHNAIDVWRCDATGDAEPPAISWSINCSAPSMRSWGPSGEQSCHFKNEASGLCLVSDGDSVTMEPCDQRVWLVEQHH